MSSVIRKLSSGGSVFAALTALALLVTAQRVESQPPGGVVAPPPVDTIAPPAGPLKAGDAIRVSVLGNPLLSGEFLIDNTGVVQIPGIGDFQVAGLGAAGLREILVTALSRELQNPQVGVQALIRVIVLGAVGEPRIYAVDPGTTVLQVIAMAGGPMPNADLKRTQVTRDARATPVNMQAALVGDAAGRIRLYSGDIVYIPERTGFTRENIGFVMGFVTAALTLVNVIVTLQR